MADYPVLTFLEALACAGVVTYILAMILDICAAARRSRKDAIEAEALRRENLAAKRFNEARQHRESSGEWKDWQ